MTYLSPFTRAVYSRAENRTLAQNCDVAVIVPCAKRLTILFRLGGGPHVKVICNSAYSHIGAFLLLLVQLA